MDSDKIFDAVIFDIRWLLKEWKEWVYFGIGGIEYWMTSVLHAIGEVAVVKLFNFVLEMEGMVVE